MGKDGAGMKGRRQKSGDDAEEPVVKRDEERVFVRSNTGKQRAHLQQRSNQQQQQQSTRSQSPLPRFLRASSEARARGASSEARARGCSSEARAPGGGPDADDARGYEGEEEAESRHVPPRALTFQARRGLKTASSQAPLRDQGAQQHSPRVANGALELPRSPPTPRETPRVLAARSPPGPSTPPPEGASPAYQRSISSNAAAGEPRWRAWGSRKSFAHVWELGSAQEREGSPGRGPKPDPQGRAEAEADGVPGSSPVQQGFPRTRHGAPAISPLRSLPRMRLPRLQVQEGGEEGERQRTPFRRLRSQGARAGGTRPRSPLDASEHTRASPQSPGGRAGSAAPKSPRFPLALALLSPRLQPLGPHWLYPEDTLGRPARPEARHGTWGRSRSSSGRPRKGRRGDAGGRDGRAGAEAGNSRGDAEARSRPARRTDSTRTRNSKGQRRGTKGKPPLTNGLGQPASPGEAAATQCAPEEEESTTPAADAGHPAFSSERTPEAGPLILDGDVCEPESPPLVRLEGQQVGERSPPSLGLEGQHAGEEGEELLMSTSRSLVLTCDGGNSGPLVEGTGRPRPAPSLQPLQVEGAGGGGAVEERTPGLDSSDEDEAAAGDPRMPFSAARGNPRMPFSAARGRPAGAGALQPRRHPLDTVEGELERRTGIEEAELEQHRGPNSEGNEVQQNGLQESAAGLQDSGDGGAGGEEGAENGTGSDKHHGGGAREVEADARREGWGCDEGGRAGEGPMKRRRPRELGKKSLRGEKGRGSLRREFVAGLQSERSRDEGTEDAPGGQGAASTGHAREAMPRVERRSSRGRLKRAENALSSTVPSLASQEPALRMGIISSRSSSHRFLSHTADPALRAEQPSLGEGANWRSNSMGASITGARRPSLSPDIHVGGEVSTPPKAGKHNGETRGDHQGEAHNEEAHGGEIQQADSATANGVQQQGAQNAWGPQDGAEAPRQDEEEGSATPRRTSSRAPSFSPAAKGLLLPRGAPQALDRRIQSMNSRSPFSRRRLQEARAPAPERSPEAAPRAQAEPLLGSEALTPSRLGKMFFSRSKSLGLRTMAGLPMPGPEKGPRLPASALPPGPAGLKTPSGPKTPAGPKTPSGPKTPAGPKTPSAADARRKARLEARQGSRSGRVSGAVPGAAEEGGLMGRGFLELAQYYQVGEKVGEGRCGVSVRRCVERSTGRAYACKSTPKSMLLEPRKVDALRTEVAILEMLQGSPGIVQLHQVLEEPQEVHMVMELCPGGDLLTHINSCPHISEKQAATFCRLIACGLQRCHEAGVLHRDLKPENVLITGRGSEADIRVADFGISALLAPGQRVTGYAGSPYYVAPEVLTGSYGVEADVWSLGVILYVLLCQHLPFWDNDDAQIYQAILQGRYDTKSGAWLNISAQGIHLVRSMLCLDPRRRITLPQVLEHPWIVQNQLHDLSGLLPATPELPDMKLSRRRRAIARTEGAMMGTLKLTFCMTSLQRTSSSEVEERPDTLPLRGRDGAAEGAAADH